MTYPNRCDNCDNYTEPELSLCPDCQAQYDAYESERRGDHS